MIDRKTAIIMLLNIDLSFRSSAMYLTATRIMTNPIIPKTDPAYGTKESNTKIAPIPPRVFACVLCNVFLIILFHQWIRDYSVLI